MAKKKISNVVLIPAVEGISRKLALRKETCTNKTFTHGPGVAAEVVVPGNTYMGISSYTRNLNGYGSVRKNFLFIRKPMTLKTASSTVLENRGYFDAAIKWVNAALKDLMAISSNQAKYDAAREDFNKHIEGVSAKGYQTERGWMTAIAFKLKQRTAELPVDHKLPDFDA